MEGHGNGISNMWWGNFSHTNRVVQSVAQEVGEPCNFLRQSTRRLLCIAALGETAKYEIPAQNLWSLLFVINDFYCSSTHSAASLPCL